MEYILKQTTKDFFVREVNYEPTWCDKADAYFTILELQKENINTFDAIQLLVSTFEVEPNQISYSGLKDEDAISIQAIAVAKILEEEDVKKVNINNRNIIIHIKGYTREQFNIGGLHGNVFNITLRNIEKYYINTLTEMANKTLKVKTINYYDNQRFGIPNTKANTHIIGKYIFENQWEKALYEYLESGNPTSEKEKLLNSSKLISCKESFFNCIDSRKLSFLINAYMSELWNNNANEWIKSNASDYRIYDNKIMNLMFLTDTSRISADNNFLKYNYYIVSNEGTLIEKEKCRQIVLYNNVVVKEFQLDDIFQDKLKVNICFYLPSGSYATILIKQLFANV